MEIQKQQISHQELIERLNIIWDLLNKRRFFESKRKIELIIDKLMEEQQEENGI